MIKIIAIALTAFSVLAQEPSQPVQPNPSTDVSIRPQACPDPLPGTEVVFPVKWGGVSVTMTMPAHVNAALNKFTAKQCEKYSKDITGKLTGVEGHELPQTTWTINLIMATFQDLVDRIVQSNPAEYGSNDAKKAAEERAAAEAKEKEARRKMAAETLKVEISVDPPQ